MNISHVTWKFINENPQIKYCLRKGLINYSSLSRIICSELNLDKKKHFDAILIACRRHHSKLKKEKEHEKKISEILKGSKLEVKNKIVVFIIEKDVYFGNITELHKDIKKQTEVFHIIEGSNTITLITTDEFTSKVEKLFKNKIIKVTKNLAEIILKSSEAVEDTPGVVAYLTSLLASNNINILETMSTWTDTLFVIEEKDIAKMMEVLRF